MFTHLCVNGVEVSEQDLQDVLKALAAQWSRTAPVHHLLSYALPHTGEERYRGPSTHYTEIRCRRTPPQSMAGHNGLQRGKL